VKKVDVSADASCTDCDDIVESITTAMRTITISLSSSMIVNEKYDVTISNALTPGTLMRGN